MKLYEPGTLKQFLAKHQITASKGLGQHFLCSGLVVSKIVESVSPFRGVLEIGPGPGVLTGPISESVERMIALEVDERMAAALADSAPKAEIRMVDALKANLADHLADLPAPRAVVSNLPYYITGPLLTKVAEARDGFDLAVLMMQKEVAERVTAAARESERGSLGVYLQSQFEIAALVDAPKGAFVPPPKVDSRVLRFRPKPLGLDSATEHAFFRLVRLGFAQPRKTLVNNLVAGFALDRDTAIEVVEKAGLPDKARPQELTLEEWRRVLAALQSP